MDQSIEGKQDVWDAGYDTGFDEGFVAGREEGHNELISFLKDLPTILGKLRTDIEVLKQK
jgi:flagellar biosynthesis/type III secretory pathway protein FliH